MSIRAMSRVWEHCIHRGRTLLLLLAIADAVDANGTAELPMPELARKTRMTARSVRYCLAALTNSGELRVNFGPSGRLRAALGDTAAARALPVEQAPQREPRQAWWAERRRKVIARDGLVCGICGGDVAPGDVDIDHIVPRSKGGGHGPDNLRVTHSRCNRGRRDRW